MSSTPTLDKITTPSLSHDSIDDTKITSSSSAIEDKTRARTSSGAGTVVAGEQEETTNKNSFGEGEKGGVEAVDRSNETEAEREHREREEAREKKYLTGSKLALVFIAMLLSVFLIALDQTIVATALPVIASEFQALDQITWIISAYFLTQAPLILVYGQVLTIFPTRWVFGVAIFLFEIGSIICGASLSSEVLIFGRAFAGVGAAGIFVSVLAIIGEITRIEDRPKLFGGFGAVFALSSVIGPLLGGAFTDAAYWGWRLCFLINVPIGLVTLVAIYFFIESTPPPGQDPNETRSSLRRFAELDWIGSILILGVTTCLILPLQEGGISKPWDDKSVIAELCVFGVLVVVFVAWEWRRGPKAILPMSLFRRRSMVGACIVSFFLMFVMLSGTYYLPLFYQAVKEHSPTKSGVDILGFMLSVVLCSMLAGVVISMTGYYWPFLVFGPIITPIGGGLLYTIDVHTGSGALIGYQILLGAGVGLSFQNTVVAIQAEFHSTPELVAQATALGTFFQLIGGVIGISISGTLFNNQLASELSKLGVSSEIIEGVKASVKTIFALDADLKELVLSGYVKALNPVFIVAVPAGIIATLGGLLVKSYNLKKMGGLANLGPA
ncbi:ABC transporter [Mrakia frigida]|uniref:MDR family MFS transporter n=1 Tax=Mrakia frigida TaxID=29902 RepID=UPI003FCC234A